LQAWARWEADLARKQARLIGRKRKDREREKKERFNLASFKLNVLGKLSYVITLVKQ
jgi:hypothetical protein